MTFKLVLPYLLGESGQFSEHSPLSKWILAVEQNRAAVVVEINIA